MPAVHDSRNVPFDEYLRLVEEILYVDSRRVEGTLCRRATGWAPESPDSAPGNPVAFPSIDFRMTPGGIYRDTGLPEPCPLARCP